MSVCSRGLWGCSKDPMWSLSMVHWTSLIRLLLVTSSGQEQRPVQNCSHDDPSPCCWHLMNAKLKHIWWVSGWNASYWNVFMFLYLLSYSARAHWRIGEMVRWETTGGHCHNWGLAGRVMSLSTTQTTAAITIIEQM